MEGLAQPLWPSALGGLFSAAVRYAHEGYPIAARVARDWNTNIAKLQRDKTTKHIFLPNGKAPREGEIHRQPQLAETIHLIAQDGGRAFYRGVIAEDIISRLNDLGAPHTADDFSACKAEWLSPISNDYRRWRVWQCPPNGQGVVALLMLAAMQKNDEWATLPEALHIHRFAEITHCAYQWRDSQLGDVPVDIKSLLAAGIADNHTSLSASASQLSNAHRDTVYLAAIDQWGWRCLSLTAFITLLAAVLRRLKAACYYTTAVYLFPYPLSIPTR